MSFVEGDTLSLVEVDLVKKALEALPKSKIADDDEAGRLASLIQKCDDDTVGRRGTPE